MGSSIFFFPRKIETFAGQSLLLGKMKRFNILLALFVLVFACKNREASPSDSANVQTEVAYASFGEAVEASNAADHYKMLGTYQDLQLQDTVAVKFKAKVNEVCQAKGCWMTLDLPNGQETRVRFKDYGFFVPKDIAGRYVIVEGNAFLQELSVEEQQHYAEEAQNETDPATITEPVVSYGFLAHGVLVAPE